MIARQLEDYLARFGKETKSVASHVQVQLWAILKEKRPANIPDNNSALVRFAIFVAVGWINAQGEADEERKAGMLERLGERVNAEAQAIFAAKNIGPETSQSSFETQNYQDQKAREKEKLLRWKQAAKNIQK